jgi:hypothetical protein
MLAAIVNEIVLILFLSSVTAARPRGSNGEWSRMRTMRFFHDRDERQHAGAQALPLPCTLSAPTVGGSWS